MSRPLRTAFVIYLLSTLGFVVVAPVHLWEHPTLYNHFSLLAECWQNGRLDLGGPPPSYAQNNDFARAFGHWYVVFPGFPALILLPWVWLLGGAQAVPDGAVFLILAGLAPVGLFLALHRIQVAKIADISPGQLLLWPLMYAFGTVYWFTAVQGTVWFAAHVITAIATCFFLWASIEVKHPFVAGIMLSIVFSTRTPLLGIGLFYCLEQYRMVALKGEGHSNRRLLRVLSAKGLVWFGLPVALTAFALMLHNYQRFGEVSEFGYRYLTVAWQARIEKWGLMSYHYFPRNLGILLSSLPYVSKSETGFNLQINGHGLALWVTSPFYLWLLWPRRKTVLHGALYVTLVLAMWPSLFYQNSGWIQFGQRFSNDYSPILFVLLGLGGFSSARLLKISCLWSVLVNLFGAVTFGNPDYARFYFVERTQRVIYEPD
jgi:hypothetical protein